MVAVSDWQHEAIVDGDSVLVFERGCSDHPPKQHNAFSLLSLEGPDHRPDAHPLAVHHPEESGATGRQVKIFVGYYSKILIGMKPT